MTFLIAIALGVVQGLTEFLPVSSSAHLEIASKLFGVDDWGAAFTAIIQIGTELAVILYFWKDIIRIITAWFKELPKTANFSALSEDAKMGWFIIIGTIPIVIAGVLMKHHIENTFRGLWILVFTLIGFGVILFLVDQFMPDDQQLQDLSLPKSIFFGVAQCFALIPGVSRSGSTISLGRFLGFSRPAAARFSFYLAIPSVFGAAILELVSVFKDWDSAVAGGFPGWPATIIATIVSFGVGYVVIAAFMKAISKISMKGFALYRIIVGALLAAGLSFGVLS